MNIRQLLRNRCKFLHIRHRYSAESEFEYCRATPASVREHEDRQMAVARSGFLVGVRMTQAVGLAGEDAVLDRDVLDIAAGKCLLTSALGRAPLARSVSSVDAVPAQISGTARFHQLLDPACGRLECACAQCEEITAVRAVRADGYSPREPAQ